MSDSVVSWATTATRWLERALALAILVAVVVFAVSSTGVLAAMDWRQTETFYQMIYRVLILVIGVELVRTLVTHDLGAVLELVAFVIARKLLKPDLTALDILLSVVAFVALLAARHYLVRPLSTPEGEGAA
jgi:hypothetical protein